jgi:hypothetical protein
VLLPVLARDGNPLGCIAAGAAAQRVKAEVDLGNG